MKKNSKWTRKDLLGLKDLSREEILLILDTAESFVEVSRRPIKKVPALRGKTVVNLFLEPSTRTRASFELAEKRLSADNLRGSACAPVGPRLRCGRRPWRAGGPTSQRAASGPPGSPSPR